MSNEPFTLNESAIRHTADQFHRELREAGNPLGEVTAEHWAGVIREYAMMHQDLPADVTGRQVLARYLRDWMSGRNLG